ncbi:hypothetical protein IJ732_05990, partial [bacterium]|nr:hypothetical protein [bacterium]
CSQCENGYQNNGTSCRDIRENTCATYSGTTCTKCTTDNLLVDNECISKSSLHCQTSNGVSCTECNSDYHDENGTCAKGYVENCSVYDGENCTQCNSSDLAVSRTNSCIAGKTLDNGTVVYKMGNYYAASTPRRAEGTYHAFTGETDAPNVWLGAYNDCESKGLHLPDRDTLSKIVSHADENNSIIYSDTSCYWSSDATEHRCSGQECVHYAVCIDANGNITKDNGWNDYNGARVLCVE